MRSANIFAISILLVVTFSTTAFITTCSGQKKQAATVKGSGFAVLELFTSEGCSSCPPAEKLLARIQEEAGDKPVYVFAYHVDYWDHQGWKDSFSSAAFSERQYQYNRQFTSQIYTPQLIINGKSEYIGSDQTGINNALQQVLTDSANATLQLQGELKEGKLKIDYRFSGDARKQQLLVAVVQRHAVSHVRAGENAGRELPHVQIVRNLYTWNLKNDTTGTQTIVLPENFNTQDWEVAGFVQNQQTGAIAAAAHATLRSL